ncbi:hypothetical protein ACOSQ3_011170 [Xanthoceras sorbifolium]
MSLFLPGVIFQWDARIRLRNRNTQGGFSFNNSYEYKSRGFFPPFSLLSVLFFLMFRLLTRMHHALLNDTNYKGICLNWQIFVRLQHDSAWPRKTMFSMILLGLEKLCFGMCFFQLHWAILYLFWHMGSVLTTFEF